MGCMCCMWGMLCVGMGRWGTIPFGTFVTFGTFGPFGTVGPFGTFGTFDYLGRLEVVVVGVGGTVLSGFLYYPGTFGTFDLVDRKLFRLVWGEPCSLVFYITLVLLLLLVLLTC